MFLPLVNWKNAEGDRIAKTMIMTTSTTIVPYVPKNLSAFKRPLSCKATAALSAGVACTAASWPTTPSCSVGSTTGETVGSFGPLSLTLGAFPVFHHDSGSILTPTRRGATAPPGVRMTLPG